MVGGPPDYCQDPIRRFAFANGQVVLAKTTKEWSSGPNGITIRYHRGFPLGMLLGAVVDESTKDASPFFTPIPIGLTKEFQSETRGTLFLKINDSASELADTQGIFEVSIVSL